MTPCDTARNKLYNRYNITSTSCVCEFTRINRIVVSVNTRAMLRTICKIIFLNTFINGNTYYRTYNCIMRIKLKYGYLTCFQPYIENYMYLIYAYHLCDWYLYCYIILDETFHPTKYT